MKTAIVYYSMSGNTDMVARKTAEELGGSLTELRPVKEYPSKGFRKFIRGGKSAVMGEKPALEPYTFDDSSDLVIIGSPVWAGNIAPPLRTFITEHREALRNKRIGVFLCCAGGNTDKTFVKLKELSGIEDFAATLVLVDPKDRQDPDNDERIREFCREVVGSSQL